MNALSGTDAAEEHHRRRRAGDPRLTGAGREVFDRITREESTGRIRYHYVLVDFVCRVAGGRLLGASDAEEARWVERDELEAYRVAPVTVQVIEKAFRVLQG